MDEKKNNTKNINTRLCIVEAILILMEKKKFQEISITEICSKAGVSRMGFYRNYNYKEELIVEHLDSLFRIYLEEFKENGPPSRSRLAESFFSHFYRHRNFIQALIRSDIQTMLLDSFIGYLKEIDTCFKGFTSERTESESFEMQFLAGGLYQLLISWIKNDCKPSLNEMAGVVNRIIAVKP